MVSSSSLIRFSSVPQRVLVTGGTGFVGRTLIRHLLADGHGVTVLSRDAQKAAGSFDRSVRCVARLDEIAADDVVDCVVNLAGARIAGFPWTAGRRRTLLDSRVGLTTKLVDWIGRRAVKPRLMLSASAVGYYGVQRQGDDTELTEQAPPQPIFMSQLCVQWEQAARAATAFGVEVQCFRLGIVLARSGTLQQMLLPVRIGLGRRLGTGRQWMAWIHVDDVMRALAHVWSMSAAGGLASGAFNFTAPGTLRQEAFARTAAEVLHRPCWLPTPAAPVRLALGEQAELILEGQRVVPKRLADTGYRFEYPEMKAALEDLTKPDHR